MLHIVFAVRLYKHRNGRLRSRPFILKGVRSPYAPTPKYGYSSKGSPLGRGSLLAQEPLRLQANCQSIASLTDSTAS